jgi:lycopene beta-cyclase
MKSQVDFVIVGGGLAGSLTALRHSLRYPEADLLLLEEGAKLGGQHVWSFRESDLTSEMFSWVGPLISKSWDETEIKFPRFKRILKGRYHAIRSEDFHTKISEKLGGKIRLHSKVVQMTDSKVFIEGGKTITGTCVIDARGLDTLAQPMLNGFRKFIGYDLILAERHTLARPLLIDASVPQLDGFRYFSAAPWDEKRVRIEEVFYSESSIINSERISRSVRSYAERNGWKIEKIEREERGILPLPMTSEWIKNSGEGDAVCIGTRGGFFHSTTGDSFAEAVRVAEFVTSLTAPTTSGARLSLSRFRRPFVSRQRFYRMINRLLFYAAEPGLRYTVMQKLLEFPDDMIARFLAGRSSWSDRLRVISSGPPVPLHRALRNFTERSVHERIGGKDLSQA